MPPPCPINVSVYLDQKSRGRWSASSLELRGWGRMLRAVISGAETDAVLRTLLHFLAFGFLYWKVGTEVLFLIPVNNWVI